jgi:hypothetical protein
MQPNPLLNPRRRGAIAFALLLAIEGGLAACDRTPQPMHDSSAPTTASSPTATAPVSLPPSASTIEGIKPDGTANANDQPMKSMSKEEESTSMPQPGQANDDSTLANDSKK